MWFKDFKRIFLTKMGRENCEKIVVVKDTKKNLNLFLFCFLFEKYISRSDLLEVDYYCSCLRLSQQSRGSAGRRQKWPLDGAVGLLPTI
jgi:hypothetical protein